MDDETQREQASPEVQARIRASFERQGLMRHLGAHITNIAPGRVHIALPSRPEVTQQDGYFHAGATSAIADSAGGYAAFTLSPENTSAAALRSKSARQLAEACQQVPPRQWWKAFAESYPRLVNPRRQPAEPSQVEGDTDDEPDRSKPEQVRKH
jgi:hypothetical protein